MTRPATCGPGPSPGLCATCANAHVVVSGRGSIFWLCELSRSDPRFRRYPALPVVRCDGYAAGEPQPRANA